MGIAPLPDGAALVLLDDDEEEVLDCVAVVLAVVDAVADDVAVDVDAGVAPNENAGAVDVDDCVLVALVVGAVLDGVLVAPNENDGWVAADDCVVIGAGVDVVAEPKLKDG